MSGITELVSINRNKMKGPPKLKMIGFLLFMHVMTTANAVGELHLIFSFVKYGTKLINLAILKGDYKALVHGLPMCIINKCVCTQ